MDVKCSKCGETTVLAASNEDRANWEQITELQAHVVPTIIDYDGQGRPVVQDISRAVRVIVGRRLVWKCPQLVEDNDLTCDETNEIVEMLDAPIVPGVPASGGDAVVVASGDVAPVGEVLGDAGEGG